jgi:hypothetical protein
VQVDARVDLGKAAGQASARAFLQSGQRRFGGGAGRASGRGSRAGGGLVGSGRTGGRGRLGLC